MNRAAVMLVLVLAGCRRGDVAKRKSVPAGDPFSLTVMALVGGNNEEFEERTLDEFAAKKPYKVRYIPAFESDYDRLLVYQQLLRDRSPQPDILEIDCIWPALLADHLVDLRPYLGNDVEAFPPELIQTYTISGRLIAIPLFVDTGLLYYRSDLLRKYGFRAPPQTWEELERMAKVIQAGERAAGHANFWGYVWQGQADEALTCNALEWQASEGGGQIMDTDGTIRVCNRGMIHALERAVSWIGTISPPGVVAYDEDDSLNVWQSGNAAFMRNWLYVYGATRDPASRVHDRFGVALMPGGSGGQRRTLGGIAVAVSEYSDHKSEAVEAIRMLTSATVQNVRAVEIGSVPTRATLQERADVMEKTPFFGTLTGKVMTGVTARPSVAAGRSYDAVSHAYFNAVHAALVHEMAPREAMEHAEAELMRITGLRRVRD